MWFSAVSLPSHARSVSLWWSVIRCGQSMCIWVPEKHTFHMLPISFEWLLSLVKVLLSLSLHFFSHISSFLRSHLSFFFFFLYYKNSLYSRSPFAAVLKIIITHITIFFSFFSTRFISGWTMQKIYMYIYIKKKRNPQKSRTRTLSKNLLVRVKPISLCEGEWTGFLLKAAPNAWIWASELWKDARRRERERGLEHTVCERERTHTLTHTLIWISFETVLWILRGDTGSQPGSERQREREREMPRQTPERRRWNDWE